jgi:hypothetical protein
MGLGDQSSLSDLTLNLKLDGTQSLKGFNFSIARGFNPWIQNEPLFPSAGAIAAFENDDSMPARCPKNTIEINRNTPSAK